MENTLQNKTKFFAQYWGQKVLIWPENENGITQKVGVTYLTSYGVKNRAVLLKSIQEISDEDALFISRIVNKVYPSSASVEDGKNFIAYFKGDNLLKLGIARVSTLLEINKKLIELGYYVGDGAEIDLGWVILKTD